MITDAVNARRREHDLHLAAAQALAVLEGAGEPLTPNEINAHLRLTSGSVTSLLDLAIQTVLIAANDLDPHAVADAAPPRGPH